MWQIVIIGVWQARFLAQITVSNETCDTHDVFLGKACLYGTHMKTDLSHWNCRLIGTGNVLRLKMRVLMADGPCPE